jgi:Putative beta-barrel porin 2
MSVKNWQVNRNAKTGGILLATGVLTAQRMMGGSVIMSQPPVVTTPPVVQEDAINNEMNVFIPSGVVNPDSAGLFQYGPVTLHPHVSNSLIYGSGIESSIGNEQDTLVDTLSPGVTADLGRHWTVDYTPTLNFYSSRQFQNSVDQSASLMGATHYEDWSFNLSQNVNISSDPLTETAAQTDQQSYSTALSAAYAFNDKWAANASVDQNISLVSELQDSYNWSTLEGVSYEFSPRLNVGISAGGGYTKVSGDATEAGSNPDSVNEEIQFNASWRATDKISLQGSVGLNDQQFLAAGYNDSLSPIFSAAIQYQPFKVTQISLSAGRSVGSSDYFIEAQTTESTTISLSLNQRILKIYNLTLGVGYSQIQYTTTLSIPGLNNSLGNARTDNDYSFNASFGRSFLTHGTWAITYQYSDNESSVAGFSQRSNQIGLQVGFSY